MADFNKEYQKRYSPGMGWDFSIKAIFAKLKDSWVFRSDHATLFG